MYAAATVTVITDGLATILLYRLLSKRMEFGQTTSRIARTAAAASLMGVVVWLADPLGLVVIILIGAASYALFATILGVIDRDVLNAFTRAASSFRRLAFASESRR